MILLQNCNVFLSQINCTCNKFRENHFYEIQSQNTSWGDVITPTNVHRQKMALQLTRQIFYNFVHRHHSPDMLVKRAIVCLFTENCRSISEFQLDSPTREFHLPSRVEVGNTGLSRRKKEKQGTSCSSSKQCTERRCNNTLLLIIILTSPPPHV